MTLTFIFDEKLQTSYNKTLINDNYLLKKLLLCLVAQKTANNKSVKP